MSVDDANAEFELIRRARMYNEENGYGKNLDRDEGGKRLLEVVSDTKVKRHWVKSDGKELLKEVVSSVREEAYEEGANESVGGVAMSRQDTGDSLRTSSKGRATKARPAA